MKQQHQPLLTPTNFSTSSGGSMDSAATAAAEARAGSGKIGTLRRAFCLLALFDLIFTCILWIFYTRYLGLDLAKAFSDQVFRYSFKNAVLDLVVLSFVRFLLLELFYALLRVKNPWIVAVTTAVSTAFIIVKIILYDYGTGHSVFDYLLPISSLLLVWTETFLLDCKVLPAERADLISQSLSEHSSLLSGRQQLVGGGAYGGWGNYHRHSAVSEGFVTPDSSPEASDDEDAANGQASVNVAYLAITNQEERSRLAQRATRLAEESWQCLEDQDWRCVHDRAPVRVLSQKSRHRASGKAWRLETTINLPAERMFEELWDRVDRQADWNPTIQFSRVIARLDADTSIVHNATVEAGGGLIKARDFVTLCIRRLRSGVRYTAGASVETALMPKSDRFTRGENYPGCIACLPQGPTSCRLVWIVDSDIKGWIPTRVTDQAMTNVMTQLGTSIQLHAGRIAQKERLIDVAPGQPIV